MGLDYNTLKSMHLHLPHSKVKMNSGCGLDILGRETTAG